MQFPNFIISKAFMLLLLSLPLQADIKLTQLANEGALLSDGKTRVMIDGLVVEPYSVYGGLPAAAAADFAANRGVFEGVDIVLSSHRHHDHHQPRFACSFLQGGGAQFYSGSQVIGLTREKCRQFVTSSPQIHEVSPEYGTPTEIERNGVKIKVFPLSHGARKYARIQNNGHLIEMGGMTVLHVGDAAMDPADYIRAGIAEIELDVALIPFWYFQPGSGAEIIEKFIKARHLVAVHIPPSEMAEVVAHMQADFPHVLILQNPLDEAEFTSNSP